MDQSTQLEEAAEDTLIPLLLGCRCGLHDLPEGELIKQCLGVELLVTTVPVELLGGMYGCTI